MKLITQRHKYHIYANLSLAFFIGAIPGSIAIMARGKQEDNFLGKDIVNGIFIFFSLLSTKYFYEKAKQNPQFERNNNESESTTIIAGATQPLNYKTFFVSLYSPKQVLVLEALLLSINGIAQAINPQPRETFAIEMGVTGAIGFCLLSIYCCLSHRQMKYGIGEFISSMIVGKSNVTLLQEVMDRYCPGQNVLVQEEENEQTPLNRGLGSSAV